MKKILKLFWVLPILFSCSKMPDPDNHTRYVMGGGVFVINEGNFRSGNGSLSFYSYDSLKLYNDVFSNVNGRPLGDVPNSMIIYAGKGYIAVNNSGKIEIIDQSTMKSTGTIEKLISPRNMAVANDYKLYVTSMYSDSIAIVPLSTNKISGYINLGCTSEAIKIIGSLAYVSNWINGNKIFVIDTWKDAVIDTISVGSEPESMAVDRFYNLWVLCSGGWSTPEKAELDRINLMNNSVDKKLPIPNLGVNPSCLTIDNAGVNLYYLQKGVRIMNVNSDQLPPQPSIPEYAGSFYKLAVNSNNGDILVTNAGDYVQKGYLNIFASDLSPKSSMEAGIIPGSICFSLNTNGVQK